LSKLPVNPTRGMRDILPEEVARRNLALSTIRAIFKGYGFEEIETPVVEALPLLGSGGGGENEKLIFKILKRGEKLQAAVEDGSLEDQLAESGLRFDLTVPLGRLYAANHHRLPRPFRSCQIGNVFRAERPQKGRYRQFLQVDIDVFGDEGPQAEVDLLSAAASALFAIGVEGFETRINDRRILEDLAQKFGFSASQHKELFISLDKLDKVESEVVLVELVGKGFDRGAAGEFLSVLTKFASESDSLAALADLSVPTEHLERLLWVKDALSLSIDRSPNILIDPLVIRGMSYYTSSVFEISHPLWGTSIAGGGRYDDMLERYQVASPACGISLGFERIMGLLDEMKVARTSDLSKTTVIYDPIDQLKAASEIATKLRDSGGVASLQMRAKNLGSQIKRLEAEALQRRSEGSTDRFFIWIADRPEPEEIAKKLQ
jgi:histidyl-tRNA synthetase